VAADLGAPLRPDGRNPRGGNLRGRSAICFLEYLTRSRITCIDHFISPEVEGRFDRNLARYGDRATKLKGSAIVLLEALRQDGRLFDVIYLDCAKERVGAHVVSMLGWSLLKPGGIIIWDDLNWRRKRPPELRAEPGSKLFIRSFWRLMEVLHHPDHDARWRGQLVARKISNDWPKYRLPVAAPTLDAAAEAQKGDSTGPVAT